MMNLFQNFFSRKVLLLGLFLAAGLTLSACSGRLMTASSWPGLAVQEDTIYVSNQQNVLAVQLSDGKQIWSFPEKAENQITFFADPLIVDDLVVVGDYKSTLYGIDAQSGLKRWSFEDAEGRWISGAVLANDTILAPNVDYSLYALDLQGNLEWKYKTNNALWGHPVSDGEAVFIGSMDHSLYAIDLKDGSLLWSTDLGGAIVSSPFLSEDGVIFIGTLGNEMLAINATNGSLLWRYKTDGGVWGTPVLHDGSLYFGDATGTIYALDENGKPQWQLDAESTITSSGSIGPDGLLFSAEAGDLLSISFEGDRLWTRPIGGEDSKLYNSPIVTEETITLATLDGENLLVVLDMSGNERWAFTPEK
jgi:eukaryotic-like serine/threonine-protein kinase